MSRPSVWLQSLLAAPPVVCGMELRPFSLIHSMVLEDFGNPVVCGGDLTPEQLMEVVFVCSLDWREIRATLWNPDKHQKRVTKGFNAKSFEQDSETIRAYIEDFTRRHPAAAPKAGKESDAPVVPWQFHTVHILCSEFNMRHDEAWNAPVGIASAYFDAYVESQGGRMAPDYQEEFNEIMVQALQAARDGDKEREAELYAKAQALTPYGKEQAAKHGG